MKQTINLFVKGAACAALLMTAAACSSELETVSPSTPEGQKVTFTALLPDEDPATRVSLEDSETGKVAVKWAEGDDIVGAFNGYNGMEYAWYGLTAGANTTSGTFEGVAPMQRDWNLLYPARHVKTTYEFGGLLTGQTQTGNGTMDHLAEYTFMGATVSNPNYPVTFRPLVAMMRFDATFKDYNAATDGAPVMLTLTRKGGGGSFMGLVLPTGSGSLPNAQYTNSLSLLLNDITLESDNKLRAYMMVPQIKLETGGSLVISVTCAGGAVYRYESTPVDAPKTYQMGYRYRSNIELTKVDNAGSEFTNDTQPSGNLEGYGDNNSPYLIKSAEDLKFLVNNVNSGTKSYAGKAIRLDTDIRVTADEWTPIGIDSKYFEGTFAGNGHTISGKLTGTGAAAHFGFFGFTKGATIQNLHIMADVSYACTGKGLEIGGLVGKMFGGKLLYCSTSGTVSGSSTGSTTIGGLGGNLCASLLDCTNRADVTLGNTTGYVGGLAGYLRDYDRIQLVVQNCVNYGAVSTTVASGTGTFIAMGGIAGMTMKTSEYGNTLTDCVNYGKVTGALQTSGISYTGGLFGYFGGGDIAAHNCFNRGEVLAGSSSGKAGNGGLVGLKSGTDQDGVCLSDCCEDTGSKLPALIGNVDNNATFTLTPCNAFHRKRSEIKSN